MHAFYYGDLPCVVDTWCASIGDWLNGMDTELIYRDTCQQGTD